MPADSLTYDCYRFVPLNRRCNRHTQNGHRKPRFQSLQSFLLITVYSLSVANKMTGKAQGMVATGASRIGSIDGFNSFCMLY